MEVTHLEQDFSHYWKYSLLGEFFWKEQEKLNERVEAWIRAGRYS